MITKKIIQIFFSLGLLLGFQQNTFSMKLGKNIKLLKTNHCLNKNNRRFSINAVSREKLLEKATPNLWPISVIMH